MLDTVVLGASFDSVEDNKAFAEKFDFPFLLLCDTQRDLGVKYGAATDKHTKTAKRISYLIDPAGKIAKVYAEVSPTTHPAQVLAHLAELAG